jgi:protein associated with RNAse G/E
MKSMLHHTTKYDGSLHYRFPTQLVSRKPDTLVLYRGPEVELESYRGSFPARMHSLFFFHRSRYYNASVSWSAEWVPHMHYVNIATPAEWDDRTVSAVDLDLDIIRRARNGEIIIDDEEEFERHIDLFGYPKKLVSRCRNELGRLHAAMKERKGMLSDALYRWRPGQRIADEFLEAL